MEFDPRRLIKEHFSKNLKTFKPLVGEVDTNYFVDTPDGDAFNLKIANPESSPENLDLQNKALAHLKQKAVPFLIPEVVPNKKGEYTTTITDLAGQTRFMRLLKWIPGRLWTEVCPHSGPLIQSLGRLAGIMSKSLADFDHPAGHRFIKWDPSQASWTKDYLSEIEGNDRIETVNYFLDLFENQAKGKLDSCRKGINYNDYNDHNILVSNNLIDPEVIGVVDFGDMVFTHTVNEAAVASAYAMMDKPDPLTVALNIVQAFNAIYPLQEEEIAMIFPLIAARLVVSVTCAAMNKKEHPENEYLLISERSAWNLLEKLKSIHPDFAHYAFRQACGLEACPLNRVYQDWLDKNRPSIGKIVNNDLAKAKVLDLSVGSLELGNNENYEDAASFERWVSSKLEENKADAALGKHDEPRAIYGTDPFKVEGNDGPEWRTVHTGLDIFSTPGSPVFAPWDGEVHSFADNDRDRDYGPTIILKHTIEPDFSFYTLYGHLSKNSLVSLKKGRKVKKGQAIATIGARNENGNWPPHLHFQIILNMFENSGDYPGVALFRQRELWRSICPDPAAFLSLNQPALTYSELTVDEILSGRREHLGKNLSLSYKQPLKIVRGYMQYLYDHTGRRYLDTVNNVPHVGHQHPRVIRAARRQMEVLNTNTRYLHENIVRYAQELCATLPEELNVCFFVNSGSEANELALRMARAYTGQKDMVVIEVGYHGNTAGCIEISDYKFSGPGGKGAPDYVHVVPIPDTYRGLYRAPDPQAGEKYALFIKETVEKVKQKGKGIAGFICESLLSCGGQVVLPENYLKKAFEHVRNEGGLCIVDEVQVGFGRVGSKFWGFELQQVIPDIVTMGKPIGNGHPLGALVTTQKVAEAFADGMEYFNTFGGNPVSCAVGREVLRIIQEEKLQEHSLKVGNTLIAELRKLQKDYPVIGDVRGSGLFIGVELVKNPERREPAAEKAFALINRMKDRGILMSREGRFNNVLKIKPPLPFDFPDVDLLIGALTRTLKEDFMRIGS